MKKLDDVNLDFLPAALEILEKPASPAGRLVGRSIITLLIIALVWAIWGEIDVVAVANGKIIPSSRVKQIQTLQKGVIKEIKVREGQLVERGQPLIELDNSITLADLDQLENDLRLARIQLFQWRKIYKRLNLGANKELDYELDLDLDDETSSMKWVEQYWRELQSKIKGLNQQLMTKEVELDSTQLEIDKTASILPIIKKRLNSLSSLQTNSYASEDSLLEVKQTLIQFEHDLKINENHKQVLYSIIGEIENKIIQLKAQISHDCLTKIEALNRDVFNLSKEIEKATMLERYQVLEAPVRGIVQELNVHTIEGVVTDAQTLMTIVPVESFLEAEVELTNKDIGFVHIGQNAEIKIETFDFTLYGSIDADVVDVTPDAIETEDGKMVYKMRLKLKEEKIRVGDTLVELLPGMNVSAEIKTAKRRIIDFFLSPISSAVDNSLGVR